MGRRYELQTLLELTIGSKNVYYQPPANIQLKYPCIVYGLAGVDSRYANNEVYLYRKKYQVTIIDKNPDSTLPGLIARLPLATFVSRYAEDNLNHTRFNLYY